MSQTIRIVHLSDTHSCHGEIEQRFGPLPPADVLLHTGDFTNDGTDEELAAFDAWLASVGDRYGAVAVIPGNHDWRAALHGLAQGTLDAATVNSGKYLKDRLPHATVLMHETLEWGGLRIFGSAWDPWQCSADPDRTTVDQHKPGSALTAAVFGRRKAWEAFAAAEASTNAPKKEADGEDEDPSDTAADAASLLHPAHRMRLIPADTDVLLTHGPARGIMDDVEGSHTAWGSSLFLRRAIEASRVRCHLFGHMHEQRGVWQRRDPTEAYTGGVEYCVRDGEPPISTPPPPPAGDPYPCRLICCNAQLNHTGIEGISQKYLRGAPRLIVAFRDADDEPWAFRVVAHF